MDDLARIQDLLADILEANAEILATSDPSHTESNLVGEGSEAPPASVGPKLKVGLFVGHNKGTGATAIDGEDEWESRNKLATLAAELLQSRGYFAYVIQRNPNVGYAAAMREHGATSKRLDLDLAIELHFNAFNGEAHGAEILVASTSTLETLGAAFIDATKAAYPGRVLRSGGAKLNREGRGRLFNLHQPCPSGIYEPCFGDSPEWREYSSDPAKEAYYLADIVERFNK